MAKKYTQYSTFGSSALKPDNMRDMQDAVILKFESIKLAYEYLKHLSSIIRIVAKHFVSRMKTDPLIGAILVPLKPKRSTVYSDTATLYGFIAFSFIFTLFVVLIV